MKSKKEIETMLNACNKRRMSDDPTVNGHGMMFHWYYALKWVLE